MAYGSVIDINASQVNISTGFFGELFQQTSFLDMAWLWSIPIIIITMLMITRNIKDWKSLALPVSIMWNTVGLIVNPFLMIAFGFMFVIEGLSFSIIGNILTVPIELMREKFKGDKDRGREMGEAKLRNARIEKEKSQKKFFDEKTAEYNPNKKS